MENLKRLPRVVSPLWFPLYGSRKTKLLTEFPHCKNGHLLMPATPAYCYTVNSHTTYMCHNDCSAPEPFQEVPTQ